MRRVTCSGWNTTVLGWLAKINISPANNNLNATSLSCMWSYVRQRVRPITSGHPTDAEIHATKTASSAQSWHPRSNPASADTRGVAVPRRNSKRTSRTGSVSWTTRQRRSQVRPTIQRSTSSPSRPSTTWTSSANSISAPSSNCVAA